MLDLKTPFDVRDSAIVPYRPKLVLADLPGVAAVLVMPNVEDLENWAASIEKASPVPGSTEDLHDLLRPGLARELQSMEEASDEFGHLSDFRAKLADLTEEVGSLDDAKKLAIELVGDSPGSVSAYRLARLLVEEGDVSSAREILEEHREELDYLGLLRLAQVQALIGSLEESASAVDQAISTNPTDYRGWMFKGTLAIASQEWSLALRYFRAALEETNSSSTLHVNLAYTYIATGQVSRAAKELRIASRINPSDENAVALLCDLALQQRTPTIAANAVDQHFAAGGRTNAFLERAAKIYFSIGEENQNGRDAYLASKKYLANLLSQSDEPHLWNNLGVIEARLGSKSKAQKHFTHAFNIALEADEDWSLAFSNLAVSHIEDSEYQNVEAATRELFQSDLVFGKRYWPKIALQRCAALEGMGHRAEAAQFLEGVVDVPHIESISYAEMLSSLVVYYSSVAPNRQKLESYLPRLADIVAISFTEFSELQHDRIFNNLAFAFLQLGDLENAREALTSIRVKIGKDPYVTATFGLEKLRAGRIDLAEDLYNQAIAMTPDRKLKDRLKQRMRYEIGRYYFEHHNFANSRKLLEESVKLKLGFDHLNYQAKQLLEQIEKSEGA